MSSASIGIPPPRGNAVLVDPAGKLAIDGLRTLIPVFNSCLLQTLDTHLGPASFGVPLAANNQNQEIVYVKISSDGNIPTLTASLGPGGVSDKINGATSQPMGTAQYSKMRLKSDGQTPGNWYIVG